MNKKAQKAVFGFAFLAVAVIFLIAVLSTVDLFKEVLDDVRDTTSLNCPGTTGFDQTDYDNDTSTEKLTRRPTCFITGISMVYFVGSFIIALAAWLVANWRKIK